MPTIGIKCLSSVFAVSMVTGCTAIVSAPLNQHSDTPVKATEVYALPKTMVGLRVDGNNITNVSVGVFTVPDRQHTYAARISESILSQDNFVFENDEFGQLKTLNATLTDKTTDAFKALAESAGRFGGLELSGKNELSEFKVIFDPHTNEGMEQARSALKAGGRNLDIECLDCAPPTPAARGPMSGIVGRAKSQIRLKICDGPCTGNGDFIVKSIGSFNASPLFVVPVRRSGFGARKTKLTFSEHGFIKSEVEKPSELVGLFELPGELVGALAGGVTKAFQDESGNVDAETALLKSRTALIEAETARLKAQTEHNSAAKTHKSETGDTTNRGVDNKGNVVSGQDKEPSPQ